MFGSLIIDEGPSLSMTDGRAVAHFMLVWKQDKYLVQHRTCLSTLLTMFIRSHFHQLTLQITKHKKSMSAKEELEQNGNLKVLKPNLPPEVLTHVNISLYTPTKQSMHY